MENEPFTTPQQPEKVNPLLDAEFISSIIYDPELTLETKIEIVKGIVQLDGGDEEQIELAGKLVEGILKKASQ